MNDMPPHDLTAERAVLGAMMNSEAAAEACRQVLTAEDFFRPAHATVFTAIRALMRESVTPDWVTVKDRLEAAGELRGQLDPVYLHTLTSSAPAPSNGPHYARIVREHAVMRRLREAATRVLQFTEPGQDVDAHGLTERAIREFETVRAAGAGDGITVQTIAEFLDVDEANDEYDWVIPGLIERGDRLMLTGAEGAGKSTLFRQMAVMAAAGVHPFTLQQFTPARVLILDFQDTPLQVRRKIRPLVTQARLQGHPVSEANLWIECRWQGVDLMQDRDLSWMLRQVTAVRPDIVFLGPLKGMAPRALHTDDEAAPVIAALDMVRARECALVLEAHSGHAIGPGGRRDVRPRGSSQFLAWPEFGYGLRWSDGDFARDECAVDMVSWRGDRDERSWPEQLVAGGTWPWRIPVQVASNGWGGAA